MIYNIKQNHTGNTDNQLLGEQKSDNCKTYRVHSCKISNTDTTNVYVHIKLHDGTNTIDILKTFLIRRGYTVELFDEPFDYPELPEIEDKDRAPRDTTRGLGASGEGVTGG